MITDNHGRKLPSIPQHKGDDNHRVVSKPIPPPRTVHYEEDSAKLREIPGNQVQNQGSGLQGYEKGKLYHYKRCATLETSYRSRNLNLRVNPSLLLNINNENNISSRVNNNDTSNTNSNNSSTLPSPTNSNNSGTLPSLTNSNPGSDNSSTLPSPRTINKTNTILSPNSNSSTNSSTLTSPIDNNNTDISNITNSQDKTDSIVKNGKTDIKFASFDEFPAKASPAGRKPRPKSERYDDKNPTFLPSSGVKRHCTLKRDDKRVNKDEESATNKRMRKNVIDELISTEQTYVNCLSAIHQHFVVPLTDNQNAKKPILAGERHKRIFLNWQNILTCHEKILQEMRSFSVSDTSPLDLVQLIASIFVDSKMNSFFQLYKHYINNFDRARIELSNARLNPTFTKFITETEEKLAIEKIGGSGLTLEGFLIMPVQRIPRYLMLIDSLIKYMAKEDEGYDDLVRARDQIQSIATLINESKRKAEKLEEVKKICLQIYGFPTEMLLSTDVNILKSGELFQKKKNQREETRFFVLLLPDYFVISSLVDKKDRDVDHTKYKFKLCDAVKLKEIRFYLDQTKQSHALKLDIHSNDILMPEKQFKLRHESDQELQQWYVTLLDAFNLSGEQNLELFEEKDLEKCYEKRKLILEKYIQSEVPYVHHLQGLISILNLEPADEPLELAIKNLDLDSQEPEKVPLDKSLEKNGTLKPKAFEIFKKKEEEEKKLKDNEPKELVTAKPERERTKVLRRKSGTKKGDAGSISARSQRSSFMDDSTQLDAPKSARSGRSATIQRSTDENGAQQPLTKTITFVEKGSPTRSASTGGEKKHTGLSPISLSNVDNIPSSPSPTKVPKLPLANHLSLNMSEKVELSNSEPDNKSKLQTTNSINSNSVPAKATSEIPKSTRRKQIMGSITSIANSARQTVSPPSPEKYLVSPRVNNSSPKKDNPTTGMTINIKPIFEALKPIIDKHVEMKTILFEKATDFKNNPHMTDLIAIFLVLFEAYDAYCSLWEARKSYFRDALKKKKSSDLAILAQQFEEIHMISVENFLTEVSTRAIQIYSILIELKQYTLSNEPDYTSLTDLCTTVERINDRIIARKMREKTEQTIPIPASGLVSVGLNREQLEKRVKRVSRGVDKAKQLISPRNDQKKLM